MMQKTPKSLRLHIGLFGRTNTGKSSLLNLIAGQDVAITSPVAGTTTDVVEKTMELLPVGPVVFLDTAGVDDTSVLSEKRILRSKKVFDVSDVIMIVTEADVWGEYEERIAEEAGKRGVPCIAVVNKIDLKQPSGQFLGMLAGTMKRIVPLSSIDRAQRDAYVNVLKKHIFEAAPDDFFNPPPLLSGLLGKNGLAVMIVPVDREAPKSRIILPQVQAIRDALDNDAASVVVKEKEYAAVLGKLKNDPDLVVCDSQVVEKMVQETPENVPCTTFSILFARHRGDIVEAARGAAALDCLEAGDRILIAEACTHHAVEDDIGRVKIPAWIRKYTGKDVAFDVVAGSDYPENLGEYKLIIHCGGCMINRRRMLARMQKAKEAGVPVTNYGICIAKLNGVAERVLSPFPAALDAFKKTQKNTRIE